MAITKEDKESIVQMLVERAKAQREEERKRSNRVLFLTTIVLLSFVAGIAYMGAVWYVQSSQPNVTIVQGSVTSYQHCTITAKVTNGVQNVTFSSCVQK